VINSGADVFGVIWDDGSVANLTDADLADATVAAKVDPKGAGSKGWIIRLGAAASGQSASAERMLRDPYVFEGVAYYKTFTPITQSTECSGGLGIDTIYAISNCTAEAAIDANGDGTRTTSERKVWAGQTDIGGGILVVTPSQGSPVVTAGNITSADKGSLNQATVVRVPKIFHWRYPEEH
jgi:hypothetical protein